MNNTTYTILRQPTETVLAAVAKHGGIPVPHFPYHFTRLPTIHRPRRGAFHAYLEAPNLCRIQIAGAMATGITKASGATQLTLRRAFITNLECDRPWRESFLRDCDTILQENKFNPALCQQPILSRISAELQRVANLHRHICSLASAGRAEQIVPLLSAHPLLLPIDAELHPASNLATHLIATGHYTAALHIMQQEPNMQVGNIKRDSKYFPSRIRAHHSMHQIEEVPVVVLPILRGDSQVAAKCFPYPNADMEILHFVKLAAGPQQQDQALAFACEARILEFLNLTQAQNKATSYGHFRLFNELFHHDANQAVRASHSTTTLLPKTVIETLAKHYALLKEWFQPAIAEVLSPATARDSNSAQILDNYTRGMQAVAQAYIAQTARTRAITR